MKTHHIPKGITHFLLLFICLMLCPACNRHYHYPPELVMADSLTNVNQPQKADSLLSAYKETALKADEPTRMYYQLLRVRTDDKLDISPHSDSLILAIVDYYEHKGDKRFLPKAYYYAGRTCVELHDEPQALAYFNKATELLSKIGDKAIDSKVYSQIGQIFQVQHLYALAIPYFRQSGSIDSLRHDTLGLTYNYRDIAFQYDKMMNDSAIIYYEKALKLARESEITFMQKSICMCLSSYLLTKHQPEKAHQYIQTSLKDMYKNELGSTYVVAGKVYDDLGMTDSAVYYFNMVLAIGSCFAKETAAWRMANIAQKRGDIKAAIEYLKEYRKQNDSVNIINHAEAVVHAQATYDYQLQEKARHKTERSNEKKKRTIIILVSVLILTVITLFYIVEYNKKKKDVFKLRIKELNRTISKQEKENLHSLESNNQQIEKLNEELKKAQNDLEISRIENEKLLLLAENVRMKNALEARNLSEMKIRTSPIFIRMREYLRENNGAKENDFKELASIIGKAYPTFINNLTKMVNMNIQDFRVCLLLKAGFKPLEISVLTIHSPQSVSTTRKRLYKKAFGKDGAPNEWDSWISQFE